MSHDKEHLNTITVKMTFAHVNAPKKTCICDLDKLFSSESCITSLRLRPNLGLLGLT